MVMSFNSLTVIFEPLALTVPKLFVELPSVILPAVPVPVFVTSVVPVTVAAPAWVMAPPVVTVRFVAVIVPSRPMHLRAAPQMHACRTVARAVAARLPQDGPSHRMPWR